jgi:hypothetical protein
VSVGKPSRDDRGELPAAVTGAADRLTPDLLACYRTSLARKPELRGTLVVGAELAADGRLESPRMEVSSVSDDGLVACVLERLARSRLAASPGAMRVSIPIRFGDAERPAR